MEHMRAVEAWDGEVCEGGSLWVWHVNGRRSGGGAREREEVWGWGM